MLTPSLVELNSLLEEPLSDEDRGHSDTENSQKEENRLVDRKQGIEKIVEQPRQHANGSNRYDSPYCGEKPNSLVKRDGSGYAAHAPTYRRQPLPQNPAPRFHGIRSQRT